VWKKRDFLINCSIIIIDLLIVNAVFFTIYHKMDDPLGMIASQKNREILLLLNVCYFLSSYFAPAKILRLGRMMKQTVLLVVLHLLLFVSYLLLLSFYVSDVRFIFFFYVSLFICLILWRIVIRYFLKLHNKSDRTVRRVIIVGGGKNGTELHKEMISQVYRRYKVIGIFDDNESIKQNFSEYKGSIADVEVFCKEHQVNEIYCTLPSSADEKIIRLVNFSEKNMIRLYIVPEFYRYIKRNLMLRNIDQVPIVAIRDEPLQYWHNRILKRLFDVLFSSLILLTVYPVIYVLLAVLIKVSSPGCIIFKQQRTGLYGKDFLCYKFRSMKNSKDADRKQAVKGDDRVTKVGKFIRKTNLDEFPQFFNVLKGDMSVVGPRPHMLKHTDEYSKLIDKYMLRHLVRPGITGWAQISGFRGETQDVNQMKERIKRDVWYIENWSLSLDIKIIFQTATKIFITDKNAY
jgi:putative colanic acid biosynthesis UDP-glucose lipid carrier transferase